MLKLFTRPFVWLGIVAAHRPIVMLAVVMACTALLAAGLPRLSADDALDSFIQSSGGEFTAFSRLKDRFPAGDVDVFVSVEGPRLFTPSNLRQMQDLAFELQLAESVASVVSIFSLRQPLAGDGVPAPIIPDEIPDDPEALADLENIIQQHPISKGRLVAPATADGQIALFIVGLDRPVLADRGTSRVMAELQGVLDEVGKAGELRLGLSGIPAMKAEVLASTRKDILIFIGAGFLVGIVVCGFFFRRILPMVIANAPGALAVAWSLGLFGWTGTQISPLMNAVMPLVLVVTFNNAMHLVFAIVQNQQGGLSKLKAIEEAVCEVGPACALTSITTAIALFSLAFSSSPLIQTFGLISGLCILICLNLVIIIVPMMSRLALREHMAPGDAAGAAAPEVIRAGLLDWLARKLARFVAGIPLTIVVLGTVLTVLLGVAYLNLKPRFLLSEMLPDHGSAAGVMNRVQARLGGLHAVNVLIEWPEDRTVRSAEVRDVIGEVHDLLERNPEITKINSLKDLQDWAEAGGLAPAQATARLFETVPKSVLERFVDSPSRSALVTGFLPDLEAEQVLRITNGVLPALSEIEARHPGFTVTMTGLSRISSVRSTEIINQLSLSMLGAVAVVIVVIGLAFGSAYVGAISVLPNVFALFATGACLMLAFGGMNYATIVGLTVAFGLAVDDTIHVLNRYRLEWASPDKRQAATVRTMHWIGKVLILTTVVLLAGLAVTQLSGVPPTRQFGLICILTLAFALLADLVYLPALILATSPKERRAAIEEANKLA